MNYSRIKELAEQNGFIHKRQPPGEQYEKLQTLEKFAELIVQECAHKLLSFASIQLSMERYDVEIPEYVQGTVYGLRCGAELIKQHFGVE